MSLVGLASVLLGGCPLRQVILAGSGNTDSAMTVLGMMGGAPIAHNFMLAAGKLPSGVMGVTSFGKGAVVIGLAITAVIGLVNSDILAKD